MGTSNSLCNVLASSIHFTVKSCGHEFAQAPGNGDGEGEPGVVQSRGSKEPDMTEQLHGLPGTSRTTRCKRASSRQTGTAGAEAASVPQGPARGYSVPALCSDRKANTRPFCVFRKLAEAAPARDKGFGPPTGWSSLTGRGGKASSWSFHCSASPRGPRAELPCPPSSRWSGGRRRAAGGSVAAGLTSLSGQRPQGLYGKGEPHAHPLARLGLSVDSSGAGPGSPRLPPPHRLPAWLWNLEQSLSDHSCYGTHGQEQGWPVASSGHLAPHLGHHPQEQSSPGRSEAPCSECQNPCPLEMTLFRV